MKSSEYIKEDEVMDVKNEEREGLLIGERLKELIGAVVNLEDDKVVEIVKSS